MVVVTAFSVLANTIDAGLTAYFRATGCTTLTIADVLPVLSKITAYEEEYVIGEMKIWDTGSEASEPNNCVMVHVMVYNDGWVVAWFDKESFNQGTTGSCSYVAADTLGSFGSFCEYLDQWNGCFLTVESSTPTDPNCPDGSVFAIRSTDSLNGEIQVHEIRDEAYHLRRIYFSSGFAYQVNVKHTNGNLIWWGHDSNTHTPLPPDMSNRLYRAIYEMWEVLAENSNSTDESPNLLTKAFLDDGGSFTDYTSQVNNSSMADFYLLPTSEAVNDAFYWGKDRKFSGIDITMYTYGVGNTVVWEYWNGFAWVDVSATDTTNGYTIEGNVRFTSPVDWVKCDVNGSEQYWVRSRCTVAAYTTRPRGTQGWVISTPCPVDYTDSNLGMYSFEHTGAKYCLVCGRYLKVSTGTGEVFFYNTSLLTKSVHSHSVSFGAYLADSSGDITPSTNGRVHLIMNGNYMQHTNGYIVYDVLDIAATVGIQNTFYIYGEAYGSSDDAYANFGSVMITD